MIAGKFAGPSEQRRLLLDVSSECYMATCASPVRTICRTGGLPPGLTVAEANICGFETLSVSLSFKLDIWIAFYSQTSSTRSCFKFIWFSVAAHHIPANRSQNVYLVHILATVYILDGCWLLLRCVKQHFSGKNSKVFGIVTPSNSVQRFGGSYRIHP
jgi:hypothetical protein